jgi:hypothetical protein
LEALDLTVSLNQINFNYNNVISLKIYFPNAAALGNGSKGIDLKKNI